MRYRIVNKIVLSIGDGHLNMSWLTSNLCFIYNILSQIERLDNSREGTFDIRTEIVQRKTSTSI